MSSVPSARSRSSTFTNPARRDQPIVSLDDGDPRAATAEHPRQLTTDEATADDN